MKFSYQKATSQSANIFGGKATNILKLYNSGVTIPNGILIDYQPFLEYLDNHRISDDVVKEVIGELKGKDTRLIIRSSANVEDQIGTTMAGVFESRIVSNADCIRNSINEIYKQALSTKVTDYIATQSHESTPIKMGLVVQEYIKSKISGVIYTGLPNNNLLVEYVEGEGNKLVDGVVAGSSIVLDGDFQIVQSKRFELNELPKGFIERLKDVLQLIEENFGGRLDIEFADDGKQLYILQSRIIGEEVKEITINNSLQDTIDYAKFQVAKYAHEEFKRFGHIEFVFSDSNYSELLPKPKQMDIGLHMYCWGGLENQAGAKQIGHRQLGYQVPNVANGLILYIGGRTYFSLARNSALYYIGVPDTFMEYNKTFMNFYIESAFKNHALAKYPQINLFKQNPSYEELVEILGTNDPTKKIKQYSEHDELIKIAAQNHSESFRVFIDNNETFLNRYDIDFSKLESNDLKTKYNELLEYMRTTSYVQFVLTARLGFYYVRELKNILKDYCIQYSLNFDETYSVLNSGIENSSISQSNIAIAKSKNKQEAIDTAKRLIGHFSSEEMLEIQHPRLEDNDNELEKYTMSIFGSDYARVLKIQVKKRNELFSQIINKIDRKEKTSFKNIYENALRYMGLRETAKDAFIKGHAPLRKILLEIARRMDIANEDIFFLFPWEIEQFMDVPQSLLHVIKSRKQHFKNSEQLDMPHVITSNNIEKIRIKKTRIYKMNSQIQGSLLSVGQRLDLATVVNVDNFNELSRIKTYTERLKTEGKSVVIAAKQLNLSHDPIIYIADGLIIKNAGFVAHGAQRAREMGKGAIGSIDTDMLTTGMLIDFNPTPNKYCITIKKTN